MSSSGHPQTLVASHPDNAHAVKSGAFSRTGRPHAQRAAEIAEAVMAAPHVAELDVLAAREIGSLVALIEAIDADIAKRGALEPRRGNPRNVVDIRLRASGRLERWLKEFGLTPASRAEWARTLAEGTLAADIARRRAAGSVQDAS